MQASPPRNTWWNWLKPPCMQFNGDQYESVEYAREVAKTKYQEEVEQFYDFLKGYMGAHAHCGSMTAVWFPGEILRSPLRSTRCTHHGVTVAAMKKIQQCGYQISVRRTRDKKGLTWRYRICMHEATPCLCIALEKQRTLLEFGAERAEFVEHPLCCSTSEDQTTETTETTEATEKAHAMTLL